MKKTNQEILNELVSECMVIVEQCGLKLPLSIEYKMNARFSRCIGRCKTNNHKDFTIEMATSYFEANVELGNMEIIKETILHEMCHTMKNGFSHGEVWKRYVGKINDKFGYNISIFTKLDDAVYQLVEYKRRK